MIVDTLFTFLNVLLMIADIALSLYILLIICRTIITHIDIDPYHYLVRFLESATEPVLEPIRRIIPSYYRGWDLSPVILIIGILLIQKLISLLNLQIKQKK